MNVLLMLIGVLIVYLAIKLVFRYNWNKGLGVALEFEKKHVVNGETINGYIQRKTSATAMCES